MRIRVAVQVVEFKSSLTNARINRWLGKRTDSRWRADATWGTLHLTEYGPTRSLALSHLQNALTKQAHFLDAEGWLDTFAARNRLDLCAGPGPWLEIALDENPAISFQRRLDSRRANERAPNA